jgi:hypothetical protein
VTSAEPTDEDFKSYAALGREVPLERRDDPDFRHRWAGLSVYDSYREARRLAQARRWRRWEYIAVLIIPDEAPIVCEGPEEHGHWNLYGVDPTFIREACMIRVVHAPSVEMLDVQS